MSIDNNDCMTPLPASEQVVPDEPAPAVIEASVQTSMVPEPSAEVVATAPVVKKASVAVSESLGLRMRAAREAKGLTLEFAAQSLRLPVAVLQALETERFDRIGHGIYLRGYLTKYLQLLDLPQVLAERVLHDLAAPPPPLVTTGTVSRPRYLFERYSGSALYLILTGVIVVPAVLLAMRAGFDQNLVHVTPLDAPEVSVPAAATNEGTNASAPSNVASTAAEAPATPPLIASMTPFPAAPAAVPAEKTAETKPEPMTSTGEHRLRLSLAQASWVEIVAADGQKLEFGLLGAGSTHEYSSAKPLDVRIGNTNGAVFEIDGRAKDLAPYSHANVAHFKLSDGEPSATVHSGG